jgi:hypothetical protein
MERDRMVVYVGRDIYQPVQVTRSLGPINLVFKCSLHSNQYTGSMREKSNKLFLALSHR